VAKHGSPFSDRSGLRLGFPLPYGGLSSFDFFGTLTQRSFSLSILLILTLSPYAACFFRYPVVLTPNLDLVATFRDVSYALPMVL
jgi:hypothetical protein